MKKLILIFAILLLFLIPVVFFYYQQEDNLTINRPITNEKWTPFRWQVDSDSTNESLDGIFRAHIVNRKNDFGAIRLEQGHKAHGKGDAEPLRMLGVTVNRTSNTPIILNLRVKRTEFRLYNASSVINIGVVLFGDIDLNYDDPDYSNPYACVIDFYYHVAPSWEGANWSPPGTSKCDNDFRVGIVMGTIPETSKEYAFQSQIDDDIEAFLAHYNLPYFTIELVQVYIEAKNGEGEIEISQIELGLH